jgi:hypothetical protein
MLASRHRVVWVALASWGCDVEPVDVHDDSEATGAGETMDVSSTSGTDEADTSSESGGESEDESEGESGGGSGGEDPPPEEPDDSCLENLPAPDSQDKVWIAAGWGFILRSTDGVNWDPLEIGGYGWAVESASVGSTFVLAYKYHEEISISDDGGLTWDLLDSGVPGGPRDVEGVGDLFLARDEDGATSYWSADGKIWQEAQGVAPQPVYAVGPAGILSGAVASQVKLSVDGKVWSELLATMGLSGGDHLLGRGDQYLAWSQSYPWLQSWSYPPSRIHSSVDGLTWTTSDIVLDLDYSPDAPAPPDSELLGLGQILDVRWNGAQYVLLADKGYPSIIARSCNGRVWGNEYVACAELTGPFCNSVDFASTPAMTVSVAYLYHSLTESGYSRINYSADLVTWGSASIPIDAKVGTVVVGDP